MADATDQAAIDRVVKQTKVVIACSGPYAKLGTPIVDACVRLGAHCVDITGDFGQVSFCSVLVPCMRMPMPMTREAPTVCTQLSRMIIIQLQVSLALLSLL